VVQAVPGLMGSDGRSQVTQRKVLAAPGPV